MLSLHLHHQCTIRGTPIRKFSISLLPCIPNCSGSFCFFDIRLPMPGKGCTKPVMEFVCAGPCEHTSSSSLIPGGLKQQLRGKQLVSISIALMPCLFLMHCETDAHAGGHLELMGSLSYCKILCKLFDRVQLLAFCAASSIPSLLSLELC